jgi:hypothetical protein
MREIIAPKKEKPYVKGLDARLEEAEPLFELKAFGEKGKYYLKVVEFKEDKETHFRYGIWELKGKSRRYLLSWGCQALDEAILVGCRDLSNLTNPAG